MRKKLTSKHNIVEKMSVLIGKRLIQSHKQIIKFKNFASLQTKPGVSILGRLMEKYKAFSNGSNVLCPNEWQTFRSETKKSLPHLKDQNIDKMLMTCCKINKNIKIKEKLEAALNFFAALKNLKVEPNFILTTDLVQIYCEKADSIGLTPEETSDLLRICNEVIAETSLILPDSLFAVIIDALCHTSEWEKTHQLIEQAEDLDVLRPNIYRIVVQKAIKENQLDLAWKLMPSAVTFNSTKKTLFSSILIVYWNFCMRQPKDEMVKHVEKLLQFIANERIDLSESATRELSYAVKSSKTGTANFFLFDESGICPMCENKLALESITTEEHNILTEEISKKVVVGDDIFIKSTPKELEEFMALVRKTIPYDFVIDGLNIAYCGEVPTNQQRAKQLATVVQYFAEQRKRVLIIGRKHMLSWPTKDINYINRNAVLYFVDNLSKDDPFLLYAALLSGPKTNILSNDYMRTHSFLLSLNNKSIFRRWQQQHQYTFTPFGVNKPLKIWRPMKCRTTAHKVNEHWHIPYIVDELYRGYTEESFEMPRTWLCCSLNQTN